MKATNKLQQTGNILKMDLRRTFRTQPFYWLILGVVVMVMVLFMTITEGTEPTITELLGSYTADAHNPMSSMMGISIVPLFAMIAFVLNIGGDFSTGFAKNIFTFHANKWEYVISKTILGTIISSIYIALFMVGLVTVGMFMGLPWGIVSVGEVVLFVLSKMLLTMPMSAIVLLAMIILRNRGWGIVTAIAVSLGAVPMLITTIGSAVDMDWLRISAQWFVSGCSGNLVTMASAGQLIRVLIVTVIWTAVCSLLTWRRLKIKDIL